MRQAASILLIFVLTSAPGRSLATASGATSQTGDQTGTIKEHVLRMPIGTPVEVIFRDSGKPKMKGKLGAVSDETFELRGAGAASQAISFADVKSVNNKRGWGIKRPLIITSAVVGALIIIGVVSYVTGSVS